jgi:hypothetical protein
MEIEAAIAGSRLRAEAEAVSLNLPQSLALDIWEGILQDDNNDWSDREYLEWTKTIEAKYSLDWEQWKDLYREVSLVMSEFGDKLD